MNKCQFEYVVFERDGGYGIGVYDNSRLSYSIDDISASETSVRKLATMFNKNNLSVVHFRQAVEDYLVDLR